jgi:hypothetical protein
MPKSNSRGLFGRSGTATVIDQPVQRSFAQKAKIVFYITWTATGLLAATVLASKWHPILALLAGGLIGLVLALIVASVVAAWPVIRAIWWWLPELALIAAVIGGWAELASHTPLWARLVITAVITGVPASIPPVRRAIYALAWCQVSRHRIRVCFSEFLIANRTGSLPFILAAVPTGAGERLWIWLRPGLALPDIIKHLDQIAAACWATSVLADKASASNAALVRIDITRRDTLTGTIRSPLTTALDGIIPGRKQATVPPQVALDLPDITPDQVTAKPAQNGPAPWPQPQRDTKPVPAPVPPAPDDGDDLSDWI